MAIVAVRTMSIGPYVLERGQQLTREMQEELPHGRVKQLIDQGYVEELVDERVEARKLEDLAFRVEKLERTVAQLAAVAQKNSTAAAKAPARKEA